MEIPRILPAMIGRDAEQKILRNALLSDRPELLAVIGRRRVGKTYLIRSVLGDLIDFEIVGLKDGDKSQQLRNFTYSLIASSGQIPDKEPEDWLSAFHLLSRYLDTLKSGKGKLVVFLDELPWVATHRSGFMTGFSYFWNSYASKNNILVVICGSAASWMIRRVINDRGGLHNRVTRQIYLQPFSLKETEQYFLGKEIHLDHYQILLLYMTLGGVPYYLSFVEKGMSAVQNIENICFLKKGGLYREFDNLYKALFDFPDRYEQIIRTLANRWKGLNRSELLEESGFNDGGGFTTVIRDLELSGFITSYRSFEKKKKDKLYRLTDCYSMFYLRFIEGTSIEEKGYWQLLSQTQAFKSWCGYAFENVCLLHIMKIKEALGISGIFSRHAAYFLKGIKDTPGIQIDLLIDRNDNVVNLCEIKFYNEEFEISTTYAENIRKKAVIFKKQTKLRKQIMITLITSYGIKSNKHSTGLVDHSLTMDDLY